MVEDLQPDENKRYRLFQKFSRESTLITLVSICLIAAIISWVRAEKAIDNAYQAQATAQTWQQMYKETERECRLSQLAVDDFRFALIKAGIELEHKGEKP